ncbi:hypothetical protein ACHHYP_11993 [Achlya hypogyna]|uniref:Uncharacterized protein n=1 Tax=Achlya hypogyna TaxID=1202772 RepID=A0A1V9YHU1_ACHHY|nr:hypothetical protein ACHHYP_11993 [Achlya hypogyna]
MDDRTAHQRRRNCIKQKRRRARESLERAELQKLVYALSQCLASRKSAVTMALPWKDVAMALKDEAAPVLETNGKIRRQLEYLEVLSNCLMAWAAAAQRTFNVPTSEDPFLWSEYPLPTDRDARRRGLEWLSQHLYHNTDRIHSYCGFPSTSAVFDGPVIDCGDDRVDLLARIQVDIDLPLEVVGEAIADLLWDYVHAKAGFHRIDHLDTDITSAMEAKTSFFRASWHHRVHYMVAREFPTPDRLVTVCGNFRHNVCDGESWRPRLFWCTVDRLALGRTRLRLLYYNAPSVLDGRRQTWRDELPECEAMDEADRWPRFVQMTSKYAADYLHQQWQQLGLDLLPVLR